jgi:ABC-type branched-subunit amino acid transport system ATPase component
MSIEELPPNTATGVPPDPGLLVTARGVTKRFGGLLAVNNVDFDIPRGSIVSLIGPNGAGKTTFFNMITGYYVPTTGTIDFDGHPIVEMRGKKAKSLKPHQVTALGIGRTFQNIRLFGTMSALDNVLVGINVHLKSHWWDSVLRTPGMLREGARRRPRAWRCSSSWTSTNGRRRGPGTSRTATSGVWRSAARWHAGQLLLLDELRPA